MDMNFNASYQLENSRVVLQPLQQYHAEKLLHFALEEPEIWTYSLVPVAGEENFNQYISQALKARAQEKEYPFAVYDKKLQSYAGSTRFYDIQLNNQVLQLGYTWYGKKFQGTGLNQHCKYLLLEFAFETLGMERVEFRADNDNARSIAAMKSIGCKVEGVLRSNMPRMLAGRRDSIVLSILKFEWEQTVKANLFAKLIW